MKIVLSKVVVVLPLGYGHPKLGGGECDVREVQRPDIQALDEPSMQDKLVAGFTGSAPWNGDNHNTLHQFVTLASQPARLAAGGMVAIPNREEQ